jgi:hypothetical protein
MNFLLITVLVGCAPSRKEWVNSYTGIQEDAFLVDEDFGCLQDLPKVGNSYYSNLNGKLEQTVAVAKDPVGKTFPVGTVVQLFPGEAMVKRHVGFSPETNDWEYFVLKIRKGETYIQTRGTEDVKNLVGSCNSCHIQVASEYDNICSEGRGCRKLPFIAKRIAEWDVRRDSRCAP